MYRVLGICTLLVCSTLAAQDLRNTIVAAGRSGVVELIDPSTLETVGRIHVDFGLQSVELSGVSASADGSSLYVEGPLPNEPHGCCALYSIDLTTLQTKLAASVPGSSSRSAFVISDGLVYLSTALTSNGISRDVSSDRLHLSPDRGWLFGVKSLGPAIEVYNVRGGQLLRQLTPEGLEGDWWPTGIWSGNRFYFYASDRNGLGRLWNISPETLQLGAGAAVAPIGQVSGCSPQSSKAITAAAGSLFLYEEFGFKGDRRTGCAGRVPGGAWVVDPATGQLTRQIAPDLYFSALLASPKGTELYGLSPGDPNWKTPAQLVRVNAVDGAILKSRYLDGGFWRIAVAPLRVVPVGDLFAKCAK